jgi:Ca2+-binding RTX toxin-like protein
MALVQLLQATDMGSLPAFGGGDSIVAEDTTHFGIIDGTSHNSYASVEGIDLAYDIFDDIKSGTILTVALDTSDSDLIPNVVVTNLAYQPHGDINFGNDLHANFVAALQIVMSGNDFVVGSAGSDHIIGYGGNDIVHGGGGGDAIDGSGGGDTLFGDAGNDVLIGGPGRDVLIGGGNLDRFDFNATAESKPGAAQRDVINDFHRTQHDRVDLSSIDADTTKGGNQGFVFIGADSFAHYHATHPTVHGMVRFSGGVLQANVNANLAADMEIQVKGLASMAPGDFFL